MASIRLVILNIVIFLPTILFANSTQLPTRISHETLFKLIIQEYQSLKTKDDFLNYSKHSFPSESHKFLQKKLLPLSAFTPPKIQLIGKNAILLNLNNNLIQINFSKWDQGQITINNQRTIANDSIPLVYSEIEEYLLNLMHSPSDISTILLPQTRAIAPIIPVALVTIGTTVVTAITTKYFTCHCSDQDCEKFMPAEERAAKETERSNKEKATQERVGGFNKCLSSADSVKNYHEREDERVKCFLNFRHLITPDDCQSSVDKFSSYYNRESARWFCMTRTTPPITKVKDCKKHSLEFSNSNDRDWVFSYCATLLASPDSHDQQRMKELKSHLDNIFLRSNKFSIDIDTNKQIDPTKAAAQ